MATSFTEVIKNPVADIEVEIKKIRSGAKPQFENLFGEYSIGNEGLSGMRLPIGTIKNLALKFGVRNMTIDGVLHKIDRNDPAASFDKIDENVLDALDDEDIDLYNHVLSLVVKHNTWMAREVPFQMVFGRFKPDDVEEENPTKASSESGSTSGSDTPDS